MPPAGPWVPACAGKQSADVGMGAPQTGAEEIKWGLPEFPQGMLHLVNMTHLTLSCHYGITELPPGITSLNRLEVGGPAAQSASSAC